MGFLCNIFSQFSYFFQSFYRKYYELKSHGFIEIRMLFQKRFDLCRHIRLAAAVRYASIVRRAVLFVAAMLFMYVLYIITFHQTYKRKEM